MKVYVIEEFQRNDEYCEYSSRVVDVYTDKETAIKQARVYAIDNIPGYLCMREDKPYDNLMYYCCLDIEYDNEAEYPKYMVITVTEHELK